MKLMSIFGVMVGICMTIILSSCSPFGGGDDVDPFAGIDAYKKAGGKMRGGVIGEEGFLPSGSDVNVSVSSAGITADEDIVWAPEDDNVPMPSGLQDLWKEPENKSWHVSYPEVMQLARQDGMPVMIWFTDSAHSPLCRKLSDDLFSKPTFDSWAAKRLVRLRVDSTIPHKERREDIGTRKRNYIEKLKKRYKVAGHPTVLILSPRGAVIARYRGYKKNSSDYYWGRMKSDVAKAEDDYGAWREKLEKRGYRLWTSRSGKKTFGKLYRYQPGKVTLIDPDGKRGVTSFRKLSDADQAWIMLQKKKRDAKKQR